MQLNHDTRIGFLQHTLVVNPNFVSPPASPTRTEVDNDILGQIADVIATFSIVSQALKTGEPLPQAFNQNLLDRLLYHGQIRHTAGPFTAESHEQTHRAHLDSVSKYEYLFYACAVSAVFQILEVCFRPASAAPRC